MALLPVQALKGYLLDTCFVSAVFNERSKNHEVANAFIDQGPPAQNAPLYYSVINVAEIGFGIKLIERKHGQSFPHLQRILHEIRNGTVLDINRQVAERYARMRFDLAVKFMPRKSMLEQVKLKELDTWGDELTNEDLQVQEGDLWLASQAAVERFTLVTFDRKLVRHKDIAHDGLEVLLIAGDEAKTP